jgi:hypothetical protein
MHAMLPAAPTETVTVEIPSLRVLTVAKFSYSDDDSVELLAPVAVVRETNTAASTARTVRPARRRAVA